MESESIKKSIVCIGDLVADIFSSPIDELPEPGELILADSFSIFPGGNALNIAIALSKMGYPVKIAGSIGDDQIGRILLNLIHEQKIDTSNINIEEGESTASTFILLKKGDDRRFISSLGAGKKFTGRNISYDIIPQNGIIVIGGYLKLFNWDNNYLIKFLKQARDMGNKIVLTISYFKDSQVDTQGLLNLLKHVDIFVPNEDEANLITGEEDIFLQSESLLSTGLKLLIITRGSRGLYAENDKYKIHMGSIPVDTMDPSGCGDCFTAGIAAGLSKNYNLIDMLKYATASGALSAAEVGCTTGIKNHESICEFLNNNSIDLEVTDISI